jgi:hypothetical protein
VSRPRDRPLRAPSATSPDRVCHLLSWGAHTSRLGEGRANDTTRSDADGRARCRVPRSCRITSPLRTTRSLTGTVDHRLDVDAGLRVCAERACVGVPRHVGAIVFGMIRRRSTGGVSRRFCRWTEEAGRSLLRGPALIFVA